MHYGLDISACDPLKIQKGQFHTYSFNMLGIFHHNVKSFIVFFQGSHIKISRL